MSTSTIYDNITESGFKPIVFNGLVFEYKVPKSIKISFKTELGKPSYIEIKKKIKKKDFNYSNKAFLNNKKDGKNVITK